MWPERLTWLGIFDNPSEQWMGSVTHSHPPDIPGLTWYQVLRAKEAYRMIDDSSVIQDRSPEVLDSMIWWKSCNVQRTAPGGARGPEIECKQVLSWQALQTQWANTQQENWLRYSHGLLQRYQTYHRLPACLTGEHVFSINSCLPAQTHSLDEECSILTSYDVIPGP